ncbi:MAG TPA: hypothetical protein VFU40_10630 [Gemmatimonadales bacterium]|nr:hypothetical protein [Gemmatimonadales bacterium]
MRNYWLRIALGALTIFVVGMVGVTLVRRGMSGVKEVAEGSGPITIPVAFVPFKLDGQRLGTIRRIRIYRHAPDKVRSVNISVRLADSVSPSRLENCILVAEGFEHFNSETTIRCASAADTAQRDLVDIGEIRLSPAGRSFRLLMPRTAIRELTESDSIFVGEDTLSSVEAARFDSIGRAAQREAESTMQAHRSVLDSLNRARRRVADSVGSR